MNKKNILLVVALCCTLHLWSQNYEVDVKTFEWKPTIPVFTPDTTDKKSPFVYLFIDKTVDYQVDPKTSEITVYYLVHTLKWLNDDKSVEDNNKIYISVGSEQNVVQIKTRVIDDGKIGFEATQKDFIEVEEDGKKYNKIALKGVKKGVMVETITAYKIGNELYGEEMFQFGVPVKKASYTLITPEHLKFNHKIYNGNGTITDSVVDKRRFAYVAFKSIPAFDDEESYTLGNANKLRVEYAFAQNVSTKKKNAKWPEMGRIFFDRMNGQYENNQKDLDKILAKINLKKINTLEEKIFAIENYIKTNIASEVNAPEPESFMDILKMKYTYPFKINQLYTQLYRKAGINCELVVTCKKDYKRFDPEFDSWAYLKNVLFYFPDINAYLDPQAEMYRLGRINSDFVEQSALFVKTITIGDLVSASASIRLIQPPPPSLDIENYTFSLSPDLVKGTIDYYREMSHYADQGLRGAYYALDDVKRKELFEGFLKGMATEAKVVEYNVQNYNITNYSEYQKPFIVQGKIETEHYIETADATKILLKVGELIGQQMEMYQAKPRLDPIDIPYAHNYKRTITVIIPSGYEVKGADKLNINHTYNNAAGKPSFGFVSSYKIEDNKFIITCNEYYYDLTYPTTQFNAYKEVINDAADFNKISILLEKR